MTHSLAIELNLTRGGDDDPVVLSLAAQEHIAPALRRVHIDIDSHSHDFDWEPGTALCTRFSLPAGVHRLRLHCAECLPAGVITLPEQTTGLIDVLPVLVDVVSGEPCKVARLWNSRTPPRHLRFLFASLFAHNTQLTALTDTFADLPELNVVPESLFFALIHARTFSGTFRRSGLTQVSGQLFNAAILAQDFTGTFSGCTGLTHVPEELFANNSQALLFDRCFADSALSSIPAALFAQSRPGGSFVETFARTAIQSVPPGLMHNLHPINVDGMFEPTEQFSHDPLRLKAGPRFAPDFFADTHTAAGTPTLRLSLPIE